MKNVLLSGDMPKRNGIGRFVEMNRGRIVEVISALFILLFLYTALSKTNDIKSTVVIIKKTLRLENYSLPFAWGIVISEYIISVLLFVPGTRKIGLYSSLSLMTAFTLYIAYMKLFLTDLPCSCGGVISKLTWNQHLAFNLIFLLLAFLGILFQRNKGT